MLRSYYPLVVVVADPMHHLYPKKQRLVLGQSIATILLVDVPSCVRPNLPPPNAVPLVSWVPDSKFAAFPPESVDYFFYGPPRVVVATARPPCSARAGVPIVVRTVSLVVPTSRSVGGAASGVVVVVEW